MIPKNTFSNWFKPLAYLALVFALVLSSLTASHAASGMHGDQHSLSGNVDLDVEGHDHIANSSTHKHHEDHSSVSHKSGDAQKSDQCCNEICMSAVLDVSGHHLEIHIASGKYVMLHAQTTSIEPSGFLRPPQFLI